MEIWKTVAVAIGSVGVILLTYRISMTIVRIEHTLERWAATNGFQILRRESRFRDDGPFFYNQYCPTYFITVEDQQHRQRNGWLRLGLWYMIGFRENIEVRWMD